MQCLSVFDIRVIIWSFIPLLVVMGTDITGDRFDIHQNQQVSDGAAYVEALIQMRSKLECAGKTLELNRRIAEYRYDSKECVIFKLSVEPDFKPQQGVHSMVLREEVFVDGGDLCTSGMTGDQLGYGSWSDETMWLTYGRITAFRIWKKPIGWLGGGDFISAIQFRFGSEWAAVHGAEYGTSYDVYLAPGEYLHMVTYHGGWVVDWFKFESNLHVYQLLSGLFTYSQDLGEELAYFTGQLIDQEGIRITDITVYQTRCY